MDDTITSILWQERTQRAGGTHGAPPFPPPALKGQQGAKQNYSFAKDDLVVEEHTVEGKLNCSYFLCLFFL